MIIALAGERRVGKDTSADILVQRYKFRRMGLADSLKNICAKGTELNKAYFFDDNLKDKTLDEKFHFSAMVVYQLIKAVRKAGIEISLAQEQILCMGFVGKEANSPREILQIVGTDMFRTHVSDSIWIDIFIKEVESYTGDIIVTDARFPNERKILKERFGAILCRVKRPSLTDKMAHVSENSLGEDSDYDVIFNNVGTAAELQSEVSLWWTFKRNSV